MTAVLMVSIVTGGVAHAVVSLYIALAPGRVLRLVLRLSPRSGWRAAGWMASVPPYTWLLGGRALEEAPSQETEDDFPRMVMAIRMIGVLSLATNAAVAGTIVVLLVRGASG